MTPNQQAVVCVDIEVLQTTGAYETYGRIEVYCQTAAGAILTSKEVHTDLVQADGYGDQKSSNSSCGLGQSTACGSGVRIYDTTAQPWSPPLTRSGDWASPNCHQDPNGHTDVGGRDRRETDRP